MLRFLARRWFLLLLAGGVGLACWRPDVLRPLTDRLAPSLAVAAALFLLAIGLPTRSLVQTLASPWAALWALVVSYGFVPPAAWLAGRVLPSADLSLGLLLIASGPCTLGSVMIWTRRARGSEPTALLTILLTTMTSWLVTPGWLALLGPGVHADLDAVRMMRELLLCLVLPVGLGQLARTAPPLARAAGRWKNVLGIVSQLLILGVVVKAAVSVADRLEGSAAGLSLGVWLATLAACLTVHLGAMAVAWWGGGTLAIGREGRIAAAFGGSQKALPVALLLFETYFKDAYPLAVVPLVFYHVSQLVVDTFIADRMALLDMRKDTDYK